jgi:hypothetical protein
MRSNKRNDAWPGIRLRAAFVTHMTVLTHYSRNPSGEAMLGNSRLPVGRRILNDVHDANDAFRPQPERRSRFTGCCRREGGSRRAERAMLRNQVETSPRPLGGIAGKWGLAISQLAGAANGTGPQKTTMTRDTAGKVGGLSRLLRDLERAVHILKFGMSRTKRCTVLMNARL